MVMDRGFRTVRKGATPPATQDTASEELKVKRRRRKRDDQGNLIPLEDEVADVPPTQPSTGQRS